MFQKSVVQTKSIKFRVVRSEIRDLTRLQKKTGARPIIQLHFTIALPRFNHCLPGGQHSPFGEGVI